MNEKKYRLQGPAVLPVPAADADKLLALRSGACALLYLYILRAGGELAADDAAATLGLGEDEVRESARALRRAGLLLEAEEVRLPPADELPEYRAEDILRRSREDPAFRGLVAEAQRNLGHTLSGADLKTLFGIYDRLGLPTDVIMLVINRCAEKARQRYGEGRLPTMRAIEKEAFVWANREIFTAGQAEEYLTALDRLEEESERVKRALQITGRELSGTERKYIDGWLALGYRAEALAVAYDRTVVGTGKLTWAYMDKIVHSWYEKKLFTPAEIEKGDARPGGRGRAQASGGARSAGAGGDDLDRLERLLGSNKR